MPLMFRAATGVLVGVAFLLASACGDGYSNTARDEESPAPAPTATLAIRGETNVIEMLGSEAYRFSPEHVEIARGGTVTWLWVAGIHNVVGDGPINHPDVVDEGGYTYSATFPSPGTYTFTCQVHPDDMNGSVKVT
jgi:plastocyanin